MKTIEWTDALVLDLEPIDTLHRTFVDVLAQTQQASDQALPLVWTALVEHTNEQFTWEDTWMKNTGFSLAPNHILQHRIVLNLLREGLALARVGQLTAVREMANELATWFAKHSQAQDTVFARHMRCRQATDSGVS